MGFPPSPRLWHRDSPFIGLAEVGDASPDALRPKGSLNLAGRIGLLVKQTFSQSHYRRIDMSGSIILEGQDRLPKRAWARLRHGGLTIL
jgi:hypothetical protein